jgi:excisionase family DNA binding protein
MIEREDHDGAQLTYPNYRRQVLADLIFLTYFKTLESRDAGSQPPQTWCRCQRLSLVGEHAMVFEQSAFSVSQLAARWGVSVRSVYDLCSRGKLGHLRIGGLIRVRLEDLKAYEALQWHAPSSNIPTTASSNGVSATTSDGGPMARTNGFQRGRKISAKRRSSSPNS